jgi:hypothetical protein
MQNDDDVLFSNGFDRDGSRTPPLFTYHTYPAPEDVLHPAYTHAQPYRPIAGASDWSRADTDYLAPVPVTLPSMMQFHDSIKRGQDETLSAFNMGYQGFSAVDIHGQHGYGDSNPHVCRPKAVQRWPKRS